MPRADDKVPKIAGRTIAPLAAGTPRMLAIAGQTELERQKMQDAERFWDTIADKYAKLRIRNMPAYEQTLAQVRRFLSPTDRVIELGCGTGSTALLLADSVAGFTGTDLSGRMIEIARSKLVGGQPGNVEFLHCDASSASLPNATYDVVLAFNLLHLLDDLPAATRAAHRLLRPGGLFISKTPCLAEKTRLLRILVWGLRKAGYAPDMRFLRFDALERAIADAGFEIVETGLYPSGSMSRFIVARKV